MNIHILKHFASLTAITFSIFLVGFSQNKLDSNSASKMTTSGMIEEGRSFSNLPVNSDMLTQKENPSSWSIQERAETRSDEFRQRLARAKQVPDSLLHNLRLLGSSGQCVGALSKDHDHTKSFVGPSPLEDNSCELVNLFDTSYHFQIYDYAMYPTLSVTAQEEGHNAAFGKMLQSVKSQTDFYCLIAKQIWLNKEGGWDRVTFEVAINLPTDGLFSELNESVIEVIQSDVKSAMMEEYIGQGGGISAIIDAELAGINRLTEIINSLINDSYSIDMTEEVLQKMKFFPVIRSTGTKLFHGTPDTSGYILDYSGRSTEQDGGITAKSDLISEFSNQRYANITIKVILTDDQNFTSNNNNYFETAKRKFDAATEEMVYWVHYHTPLVDTLPGIPYIKTKNNFTSEKTDQLLEKFWTEYKAGLPSGPARPAHVNNRNCVCPNFDFALNWKAETNILSCIEDPVAMNCFGGFGPLVTSMFATSPGKIGLYQAGFVCGLIDGALEQANFLYGVATGIIDFAKYSFIKRPTLIFSPGGTILAVGCVGDILYKAICKAAIENGWKFWKWDLGPDKIYEGYLDHISEAEEYWCQINEMYLLMTNPDTWRNIVGGLISSFTSWLGDVSGVNGVKEAGYTHGIAVWEIIIDFISAGTTILAKGGGKLLGELFEHLNVQDLAGYAKKKVDEMPAHKKAECRILGVGCFIRGTGVTSALGLMPIEKMNPFLTFPKGAMVKFATQNTFKYINK
ncbi:MAG: hypothetical protein J0M29_19185 [Chitinophagales bacterium]|nr:hypothetical protein [Chitinophagales bacterium]